MLTHKLIGNTTHTDSNKQNQNENIENCTFETKDESADAIEDNSAEETEDSSAEETEDCSAQETEDNLAKKTEDNSAEETDEKDSIAVVWKKGKLTARHLSIQKARDFFDKL